MGDNQATNKPRDQKEIAKRIPRLPGGGPFAPKPENVLRMEDIIEGDHLDTMRQLLKLNGQAHELLRKSLRQKGGDKVLAVRVMAEIRQQLEFQLKVYSTLYDLVAHAEFQRDALIEIEAVSPEVKERLVARLREWRSRRAAAGLKNF
jgi:hypothetical protein